jgi:hypothetical protein
MICSTRTSLRCTFSQIVTAYRSTFQQQCREKHSKTQIRRRFNKNPAVYRMRLKQREDLQRLNPSKVEKEQGPPELKFPQVFEPIFISNGWSKPPSRDPDNKDFINLSIYPFQVARTGNKPMNAAGFLPVYTDFRYVRKLSLDLIWNLFSTTLLMIANFSRPLLYVLQRIGRTKVTTIIRKTSGDINELVRELKVYLQISNKEETPKIPEIKIGTGGNVVVNGNYAREIRRWLAGLGF